MSIGIESIEYFLPSKYITSKELASKFGFSLSFIEEKVGIKRIFVADENEKTSDLAIESTKKIIEKTPEVKEKIGVVVLCTQTPDYQLPHTAAIVQKNLGLADSIASFDISLGCSGFVYGLSVVRSFMECNGIDYGLLVTAETYSKIINDQDKNTKPLFSDASASSLLSRKPCLVPNRFTFGTNGYGYESLILKSGDPKNPSDEAHLYMDGRSIFEFAATVVPEDLNRCLSINGIDLDSVDYFVFHQASNYMIDAIAKGLGILGDKRVVKCLERFGNTVSSSIPIALKSIFNEFEKEQVKILITGFGVGLSWASTLLVTEGTQKNA